LLPSDHFVKVAADQIVSNMLLIAKRKKRVTVAKFKEIRNRYNQLRALLVPPVEFNDLLQPDTLQYLMSLPNSDVLPRGKLVGDWINLIPQPGVTPFIPPNHKVCGHCAREGSDLLLCARCKSKHYCNADCQKADWLEHKKVCGK